MKSWKNVLVHADARVDTRGAIQQGFEIAEACSGRVTLFDSVPSGYTGGCPDRGPDAARQLSDALAARVHQLEAESVRFNPRSPVEVMVRPGRSTRALLKYAAHTSADLIVSTASSTDVRELTPCGASALQLLRSSPVPVWLCAPGTLRAARVVAIVDLSSGDVDSQQLNEDVALAAARLSLIHHAELHVVCVADAARDRIFRSIMRPAQYRRHLAQHRAELRTALHELVLRIGARPIAHLIEGDAADALERLLADLQANTLVLGRDSSHPRRSDLAEQLLCRADRSLLLIHSKRAPARVENGRVTPDGARPSVAQSADG